MTKTESPAQLRRRLARRKAPMTKAGGCVHKGYVLDTGAYTSKHGYVRMVHYRTGKSRYFKLKSHGGCKR